MARTWSEPVIGWAIPFEKTINCRDLGGYPTQDGRWVRCGLIFRSGGSIAPAARRDRELFHAMGLKAVLDLRSPGEQKAMPDRLPEGIEYLRISAMYHPDGSELDFPPPAWKSWPPGI